MEKVSLDNKIFFTLKNYSLKDILRNQKWFFYGIAMKIPFWILCFLFRFLKSISKLNKWILYFMFTKAKIIKIFN